MELACEPALLLLLRRGHLLEEARAHLGMVATLGDVVGHDGVPDESSLRIADRGDEALRPESAPVLADPPALFDRLAVGRRPLERSRGRALTGLLGGIEARDVLADDLVRGVSLEPFGTRVPALDAPRTVEHVEGVVAHA